MALAAATVTCRWVGVAYTGKSVFGGTLYKWHHRVEWCYNGATVTKWNARYDYVTAKDAAIQFGALLVDQAGGIGTSSAWSHRQRQMDNCVVKYGCFASYAPWSKITVRANGTYTYTGAGQ